MRGHSASIEYVKMPHPRLFRPPVSCICRLCPAGKMNVIENGKYIVIGL